MKINRNNRMRLHLHKSLKNISAQIIDNSKGITLVSASSIEKGIKSSDKSNKSKLSILVGELLAKRAQEKKINKIYFDRGYYKYHGRIKILIDALRNKGIEI